MAVQSIFKEHVSWYEATLSVKERRSLGHFSTPPRLVEHILDACGYTTDKNLANIRVLDPACGSGNFLVGAARRLLAFGTRTDLTQTELTTLMQRNIWGFDADPISCFLAEMQLRTTIAGELVEGAMHWGPEWGVRTSWHIHQADGLALRWNNEPSVDLFVANPPYLATKNADL